MVLMNLYAGQQWRRRQREQTYGHGEQEEEGGANGESSMETYTLIYVKQIAGGNLPYDSGNAHQGSVTTSRGGMGWEVGGRLRRDRAYVCL